MKKVRIFAFLLAVLPVFLIAVSGLSEQGPTETAGVVAKVTTAKGPLKMRAKASDRSTVILSVPNGTCLLVREEGTEWCLCEWNGKTGYCSTSFLTILRDADPRMLDYRVLRQGDKGDDVLAVKQRLQELGYIRAGKTLTNVYSAVLAERIMLFQRQIGVTEDGTASQELQAYLFSERAPQCSLDLPAARSPMKNGNNGLHREVCGCCMGEGCECCGFTGWIYY